MDSFNHLLILQICTECQLCVTNGDQGTVLSLKNSDWGGGWYRGHNTTDMQLCCSVITTLTEDIWGLGTHSPKPNGWAKEAFPGGI